MLGTLTESVSPVAGDFASGIVPAAVKPLLENLTNWSFFRESPVVPRSRAGLPPEEQYGPYTSTAAKLVGKQFGVSPAKVDNVVTGYFGGMGRYATQAVDAGLKLAGVASPGGGAGQRSPPTYPTSPSSSRSCRSQSTHDGRTVHPRLLRQHETIPSVAAILILCPLFRQREAGRRDKRVHPEYSLALDFQRRAKEFSEMRREMEKISGALSLTPSEKKAKLNAMAINMTRKAKDLNAEFERRRKKGK